MPQTRAVRPNRIGPNTLAPDPVLTEKQADIWAVSGTGT